MVFVVIGETNNGPIRTLQTIENILARDVPISPLVLRMKRFTHPALFKSL